MISNITYNLGGALTKACKQRQSEKSRRVTIVEEPKKGRKVVIVEEETVKEKPNKGRKVVIVEEEKAFYSSQEVAELDPITVLELFIHLTGLTSLGCKHCGSSIRKETYVWDNWTNSIYTRALKYGLSADMKLPKSCDKQLEYNNRTNKVNNATYRVLKSDKYDEETKKEMLKLREELLHEMGMKTCPRVYRLE